MGYLVRFIFVLALGLMGCSETAEFAHEECPAEAPFDERCVGDLACPYGSTSCCNEWRPYIYCVCKHGTFECYIDDCLPGGCEGTGGVGGDGGSAGVGTGGSAGSGGTGGSEL